MGWSKGTVMTEEEWNNKDLAFEKALRKLRDEFPEFYIEVWDHMTLLLESTEKSFNHTT